MVGAHAETEVSILRTFRPWEENGRYQREREQFTFGHHAGPLIDNP
jgi:hypothetical protein